MLKDYVARERPHYCQGYQCFAPHSHNFKTIGLATVGVYKGKELDAYKGFDFIY